MRAHLPVTAPTYMRAQFGDRATRRVPREHERRVREKSVRGARANRWQRADESIGAANLYASEMAFAREAFDCGPKDTSKGCASSFQADLGVSAKDRGRSLGWIGLRRRPACERERLHNSAKAF